MADEIPAVAEESGLPSDSGVSEYAQDNMKDGKWFGKFDSVDDMAKSYRELEVNHTNKMREFSDEAKGREADAQATVDAQTKTTEQQDLMSSMVGDYMNNDMELTTEQEQKLVDSGIDVRDVKLGAIELRDKINVAHSATGGRENYEGMMSWADRKSVV